MRLPLANNNSMLQGSAENKILKLLIISHEFDETLLTLPKFVILLAICNKTISGSCLYLHQGPAYVMKLVALCLSQFLQQLSA